MEDVEPAEFINAAGVFRIHTDVKSVMLEIQNDPGADDETDRVTVHIPNLKYVGLGNYTSDTDKYYKYTFGVKNEGGIEIFTANRPDDGFGAVQFGGIDIWIPNYMSVRRFPELQNTFEFFTALHNALQDEVKRQAKLKGRNIASLKKTLLAPVSEYSKAQNVLTMPGIGNTVASFLSGKPGSLNQQVAALKKNAGVPNARRRKTRRRKNSV